LKNQRKNDIRQEKRKYSGIKREFRIGVLLLLQQFMFFGNEKKANNIDLH